MKKIKVLLTTLLVFGLGTFIAGEAFALTTYPGGGIHDYGQNWSWVYVRQYSNYYHGSLYHRSSVYQNGCYYYSGGSRNAWYGPGSWSTAAGPWESELWGYNSYWATR